VYARHGDTICAREELRKKGKDAASPHSGGLGALYLRAMRWFEHWSADLMRDKSAAGTALSEEFGKRQAKCPPASFMAGASTTCVNFKFLLLYLHYAAI
jgi:hypothetical protein